MELRGKLHSITRDMRDRDFYITFKVASIPEGVDRYQEKDLAIEVKQYREKRSRNANAYYWELVGRIASVLGVSRPYIHNMLLRDYGTLEDENLGGWLPENPETELLVLESDKYHFAPTSHSKLIDGELFTWYRIIKGSSQYDTAEMARLIDGAVSEAKGMDIEVLPPEELERIMKAYEEHYANGR